MYVLGVASLRHFMLEGDHARYANLVVYWIDPSRHTRAEILHQFANAVQGIHTLKKAGLPREHCIFLERLFFTYLPDSLRTWLAAAGYRLLAHLAGRVWAPDYRWRTGRFAGHTTLEAMHVQWERHTSGACESACVAVSDTKSC